MATGDLRAQNYRNQQVRHDLLPGPTRRSGQLPEMNLLQVQARRSLAGIPPPLVTFDIDAMFGHVLFNSEGGFGRLYVLPYQNTSDTDDRYKYKRNLDRIKAYCKHLVFASDVPAGREVIVKVQYERQPSGVLRADQWNDEVSDWAREAVWHKYLHGRQCMRMQELSRSHCISDVIPRFYWSGVIVHRPGNGQPKLCSITVMDKAPGHTIRDYLEGPKIRNARGVFTGQRNTSRARPLTAKIYAAMERGVVLMWLHGAIHGDFHFGNQMYDPVTDKISIVDFGMTSKIPAPVVNRIKKTVPKAIGAGVASLAELWYTKTMNRTAPGGGTGEKSFFGLGLQKISDALYRSQGFPWYNPDGQALRRLFMRLSAAERAKLNRERQDLWGYIPKAERRGPATADQGSATAGMAPSLFGGLVGHLHAQGYMAPTVMTPSRRRPREPATPTASASPANRPRASQGRRINPYTNSITRRVAEAMRQGRTTVNLSNLGGPTPMRID